MDLVAGKVAWRLTNFLLGLQQVALFSQAGGRWPRKAQRILVHRPGNIGDTIVAVPALLAVRRLYPAARLTLLTSPGKADRPCAVDMLEGTGLVDDCVVYHRAQRHELAEWLLLARALARSRFDLFVGLSSAGGGRRVRALFRDMVFAKALGCHAVGGFRLPSLPHPWAGSRNDADRMFLPEFKRLLALVPGGTAFWDRARFEWPGLMALKEEAAQLLKPHELDGERGFIVLHPGAKLPLKQWMPDRFGSLARRLSEDYGASVVLTGGGGERAVCERVRRSLPCGQCVNLAGTTSMRQFFGVLAGARAVVSNDTGAMHVAAAVGTPCLAITSGRDRPAKWQPIADRQLRLRAEVDCSPCFRSECSSRECLAKISVADAARAFDELWRTHVA